MDGWMDGWIDGCMDGWMDAWMDGWMDEWILTSKVDPRTVRVKLFVMAVDP